MSLPLPVVCDPSPDCCGVPSPPFYTQGETFLNAQTGFLLECPPGFSCDAGLYPHPIIVPKGRIPFTPPTNGAPLRFTCCDGVILTRFLPIGYTQAQFNATAQSIVDDAATHLAGCMATQYNQQHAHRPAHCSITTASPMPDGTVGTPYSETLTQTGAVAPVTWSLMSGALPAGLSLSSSGVIAGTPTTAASYAFVVRARDSTGSCTKQLTITINDNCAGVTDWCVGPGLNTCRLRIKDFVLADWQDVCTGGYFATWDGTFSFATTIGGNPCTLYVAPLPGVTFLPPSGVYLIWDGSEWVFHAQLPAPATGLVAVSNGPAVQASPIGVFTPSGPTCTGPASFEIESYTP